tara:strand:+ start:2147 stop:3532 length:1386 start_codon:yes stop_codon:yes gene_type:complete
MNMQTNITPETFDLTKLVLKVPGRKFKGSTGTGDEINIIGPSVELSIFEHISVPFLTAKLLLVDDFGLLDFPGIQGTEKITVEFGHPASYIKNITKTFILRGISGSDAYNDYTNVLVLDLIEDIGFYDRAQKISKGYTGTGEKIIKAILRDKLGKELDTTNCTDSYQSAFKYVVPYITPLQACQQVLSKMTTATGCPYFLYSSIYSDKLILTDMESIFKNDAFNKKTPFIFSQGQANAPYSNFLSNATSLKSFKGSDLEDTLELVEDGAGGILYNYISIGNETRNNSIHYSAVSDVIESLEAANIIKKDELSRLINENFIVDPSEKIMLTLGDMNSKVITAITTSNYPLDNIFSFNEDVSIRDGALNEFKKALLLYLTKNIYDVEAPGFLFLPLANDNTNIRMSVGNQVEFLNHKDTETFSKNNSGRYIMLAKRHILDIPERTHNVSLQCGRISNQTSLKG